MSGEEAGISLLAGSRQPRLLRGARCLVAMFFGLLAGTSISTCIVLLLALLPCPIPWAAELSATVLAGGAAFGSILSFACTRRLRRQIRVERNPRRTRLRNKSAALLLLIGMLIAVQLPEGVDSPYYCTL